MEDTRVRRTVILGAAAGAVLAGVGGAVLATGGQPTAEPAPRDHPAVPASGPLAFLADLPMHHPVPAHAADGTPLLLVRTAPAEVRAMDARCTHRGCVVKLMGAELACPCHNSRFDPETGNRIRGVAPTGLRPFPVRVSGGAVLPG